MNEISIIFTAIGSLATILSIIFCILTFASNKSRNTANLESRLTRIETDIIYIRQALDERKEWQINIEKRLTNLERHQK